MRLNPLSNSKKSPEPELPDWLKTIWTESIRGAKLLDSNTRDLDNNEAMNDEKEAKRATDESNEYVRQGKFDVVPPIQIDPHVEVAPRKTRLIIDLQGFLGTNE